MATSTSSDNKPSTSAMAMAVSSPKASLTSTKPVTSAASSSYASAAGVSIPSEPRLLDKRRLEDLLKEVDENEQLEDDVEEMLMQITDDFIDNVVTASCQLAKHRKATTVEVKDVQLHLERSWNMWVPGFGGDEIRPYKKSVATEAHKQRVAIIKKSQKKI